MNVLRSQLIDLLYTFGLGVVIALFLTTFLIVVLISKRNMKRKKRVIIEDKETTNDMNDRIEEFSNERIERIHNLDESNSFFKEPLIKEEAGELILHCLAILKIVGSFTQHLTTLAMDNLNSSGDGLSSIVDCARCITSKVDDMVTCMSPPFNASLLEARASGLMLAVSQLAMIAKYECQDKNVDVDWIDAALREIKMHLKILRDAAFKNENSLENDGKSDDNIRCNS